MSRVFRALARLRGHLAVDLQFRHVVDNAEQLPLGVDLGLSAQRESPQAALLDVTEHRFNQSHALGVDRAAFVTVYFLAHGATVRVGQFACHGTLEEGHLAHGGEIRFTQALAAQRTRFAESKNLCGGLRAMHGVVIQRVCVVIDFTSEHDPQLACVFVGNHQNWGRLFEN